MACGDELTAVARNSGKEGLKMKRFCAGLAAGLALGSVAAAVAATVEGDRGYLRGWDVTTSDGKTICSDPYIWPTPHQIQCDFQKGAEKPTHD